MTVCPFLLLLFQQLINCSCWLQALPASSVLMLLVRRQTQPFANLRNCEMANW